MPFVFIYLLKLFISLTVVFLFYHFVLRRLTFYNWNRWYLLGYSLLSFILPFVDISRALDESSVAYSNIVTWVPVIGKQLSQHSITGSTEYTYWDYLLWFILAGALLFLLRLGLQLISVSRLRRNAILIEANDVRIYQVDKAISPFSFGRSVFLNRELHPENELDKIIRHEIVHVKQQHSIDILWGEILCIVNWFNPFAWLLKKSIRQNLEFIADRQVLEQGFDRKQYQYLLLKVIGNNQFSIANQFNLTSLKKRIAMMNKLRSTRVHLVKFMFILPLVSVMLLAFRNEWKKMQVKPVTVSAAGIKDTLPDKLPPPPPPPAGPGMPGVLKDFLRKNPSVKNAGWVFNTDNTVAIFHIMKKDGTVEEYHANNKNEMDAGIKKYGSLPEPPHEAPFPPPPPPSPAKGVQSPAAPAVIKDVVVEGYPSPVVPPVPAPPPPLPANVQSISIENKRSVTVMLKSGEKEIYDLSNPDMKKKFEGKYGKIPPPPPPPVVAGRVDEVVVTGYPTPVAGVQAKEVVVQGHAAVAPVPATGVQVKEVVVTGYPTDASVTDKPVMLKLQKEGEPDPLYVLNGEVVEKKVIAKLDPGIINMVNVLKGQKATDKYGEKGKNGVIEIVTK